MSEAIRVLIADDHTLLRRGLAVVLDTEDDIEVVGEASDGAEAVVKAEELAPDVVILDVRMPDTDGLAACAAIKRSVPDAKVIMLTSSDEEADLYEAVKSGASGYLLKSVLPHTIPDALRAVQRGESQVSPSMAAKLLTGFAALARGAEAPSAPVPAAAPKLTDREMEVLKLVATGRNNREIAKELFITENTVKNHVRNILEKLQLHSRMEAVVYAVREKLLEIT
ncbi:response regulator transcription factor [Catenulispora subtropica]|uniref:Response regulator transcription factor n=1 Tax=Catenulispora subtropica TaxID=450798 RepID=A0ABP5CE83_9ACTN